MDIAEAFTEKAIADAGANVGASEEDELREVIREIYAANEMSVPERDPENVAVLCFVAGRVWQESQDTIPVNMGRMLAADFIEFLSQRGAQ